MEHRFDACTMRHAAGCTITLPAPTPHRLISAHLGGSASTNSDPRSLCFRVFPRGARVSKKESLGRRAHGMVGNSETNFQNWPNSSVVGAIAVRDPEARGGWTVGSADRPRIAPAPAHVENLCRPRRFNRHALHSKSRRKATTSARRLRQLPRRPRAFLAPTFSTPTAVGISPSSLANAGLTCGDIRNSTFSR